MKSRNAQFGGRGGSCLQGSTGQYSRRPVTTDCAGVQTALTVPSLLSVSMSQAALSLATSHRIAPYCTSLHPHCYCHTVTAALLLPHCYCRTVVKNLLLHCRFFTPSVCWTQNQRFASSHFCKKSSHIICGHVGGLFVTTLHSQSFTSYLHQNEEFSRGRHVFILFSTKLPPQLKLPVQTLYVTLGLQAELHNCRCHVTSLRSPPCC